MKNLSEVLGRVPAVRGAVIILDAAKAAKKEAKRALRVDGEEVRVHYSPELFGRGRMKFVASDAALARFEAAKAARVQAKADVLAALVIAGVTRKAIKHIAKEL